MNNSELFLKPGMEVEICEPKFKNKFIATIIERNLSKEWGTPNARWYVQEKGKTARRSFHECFITRIISGTDCPIGGTMVVTLTFK